MKSLFVKAALVLGLALLSMPAMAQYGSTRGKVLDDKGQPVMDARVTIEFQGGVSRKLETKTNKKGEFTQVGLSPGDYKFTVTKEGLAGSYLVTRVNLGEATNIPEITLQAPKAAGGGGMTPAAADALRESFKKAVDMQNAGQLDEAEAALKDLAAKNPTVPEIPLRLGILYGTKKDWANAETQIKKALEIRPDFNEATMELASLYQRSGQKDKATELMAKAAATGGDDPMVQLNVGITALNSGNYDAAEVAFKKAAELKPDLAEAYYHMSTIHLNKGQTPDAIADLEKYLSLNPTNAQNVATAKALLQAIKK